MDVTALLQQLMLQEAQQQASASALLGQQVGLRPCCCTVGADRP